MKFAVATSSLAVVLVAAAAATVVMTEATAAAAAPLSSAVSATATALSPRAAAAKRSLLDINDPNDHELHAAAEDDADEHNAMTSGDGYNLYAADAAHSSQEGRHRRLAYNGPMADVLADFEPLPCNAAVACDAATPLSSVLGGAGLVTLTCGTCYTVDQTGDVAIPGGLNIE